MSVASEIKKILATVGLEYFNRYYGIYKGFVVSHEDPEFYGRLTLRIPQIYGDTVHDYWAYSKGMYAGKGVGFYALPNPGDPVWVSFENGDPRFPVWEYGWFRKGDTPELARQKNVAVFQTTQNQRMYFNDDEGFVRVQSSAGTTVEINNGHISLGSEGKSEYSAVLGEKNADLHDLVIALVESMNTYVEIFSAAQIATAAAIPIYAPMTANWTAMQTAAQALKPFIEQAKKSVPSTLSKVVTLD